MKKICISLLSIAAVTLSACNWQGIRGNGHIVTDQRTIEDFSEIDARGGFDIEWRNGPASISITTDENLLPYIVTRKIDNRLELRTRERVHPRHGIKVVVFSSTRSAVKLSGAGDLKMSGLTGPRFAVESSGAADVTLDGAVDELLADMTGASDLKAKSLQARIVQISTTGAASASVNASDTLRVAITGAGDVTYFGNPKTIEKHVTGAGSIHHKD
ncbi:MAG: head GIN domain-containing protein [Chthoniobacterales bacterium]